MKILTIQGVQFNLDALKGTTKDKFIAQNKDRFKNIDHIWSMIEDKIEVAKPKKKRKKLKKVEEKLAEDKVNKPEFD